MTIHAIPELELHPTKGWRGRHVRKRGANKRTKRSQVLDKHEASVRFWMRNTRYWKAYGINPDIAALTEAERRRGE